MGVEVGIVMGSKSDEPTMQKGADLLAELGVDCEMVVSSAHRNPERTAEYARGARGRGLRVLIAGAGLAAALPGVLAAHTNASRYRGSCGVRGPEWTGLSLFDRADAPRDTSGHRGNRQRPQCRHVGGADPGSFG